jgi:hypothetical protein
MFWIKGKPGSGKSTLMKYILNDYRTQKALSANSRRHLCTAAFFFHDRGVHEDQKSFEGLLRSIIHQILESVPELLLAIVDIYRRALAEDGQCRWSIHELEAALRKILHQKDVLGCICLFIDALDEYKGRKDDISRFLKDLVEVTPGQQLVIRICASSREWNVFSQLLGGNPTLTLQDWTKDDIRLFASERLEEAHREGTDIVVQEITARAEGVFLWVKLVIRELWQPLCDGEPMKGVLALLSELPDELPQFYERMLKSVPAKDYSTALGLIGLVLSSEMLSFEAAEFRFAFDLIRGDNMLPEDFVSRFSVKDYDLNDETIRHVRALSGGLLEVVGPKTVQFIHQTAKTYVHISEDRTMFRGNTGKELALDGLYRRMRLFLLLVAHMNLRSVTFSILPSIHTSTVY